MGYVYRYRDNADGIIKYVGIVYGKTRTLEQRIYEHLLNDEWCNTDFTIEYITEDIDNRSEAECFESHYISLYRTDKYFNKAKSDWGINKYLPDREKDFLVYSLPFSNDEIKVLYETYGYKVIPINVYKSGNRYKCIDKRRSDILSERIDNEHYHEIFYTFNKEKAYLYIKEKILRSIKLTEDSYRFSIDRLNKELENINATLKDIKKNG